ncbi:endonuclease VII domain-containing protein [Streptomyces sp. NBC_01590]|uniref:endonuclease VII domain-containing protein n=2 Tax=Streptomyces sp. NBC_01590 TaxID=2975887 RepID=UPI00386A4AD5
MVHKYGIGWERRMEIAQEQGDVCPVCGAPDDIATGEGLHVDHCHDSGAVRGLLCGACNRAIGLMRDNIDVLRAAISYLERQGAKAPSLH